LQRFYNLSDDQIEFQINDRSTFMKTVWNFREKLIDLEIVNELFNLFLNSLEKIGLIVNQGKIVDASFVEVPKQRNKKEENATIKKGEIPESFQEKPNKLAQKDTDSRWTKKNQGFVHVLSIFLVLWKIV